MNDPEKGRGPTPYTTSTQGVKISVWPDYLPEQSRPDAGLYFYAYTIKIQNDGLQSVQLVSRHWVITDAFERVEHVIGEGVIGQQPVLKPGEFFAYTSSCPLKTPSGTMEGTYKMKVADGNSFDAKIGKFQLRHASLVN